MERFDWEKCVSTTGKLEVLKCEEPISCSPALAATVLVGLSAGFAAGYAQCHYHGCVTQAGDIEAPDDMGAISVGDLLQFRSDVAASH